MENIGDIYTSTMVRLMLSCSYYYFTFYFLRAISFFTNFLMNKAIGITMAIITSRIAKIITRTFFCVNTENTKDANAPNANT